MTGEPRGFSRVAAGFSSYDEEFRMPLVLLACEIAVSVVKEFIKEYDVFDKIVFCTLTLENYAIYEEELKRNNML